jgi:hypothetical protein
MIDPVCGMDVEPSNVAGSHAPQRADLFFSATITVFRNSRKNGNVHTLFAGFASGLFVF